MIKQFESEPGGTRKKSRKTSPLTDYLFDGEFVNIAGKKISIDSMGAEVQELMSKHIENWVSYKIAALHVSVIVLEANS